MENLPSFGDQRRWNLSNENTIGTTVNSPVQWNLSNEDTIGTTVNSLVQWNLYNEDTSKQSCTVEPLQ